LPDQETAKPDADRRANYHANRRLKTTGLMSLIGHELQHTIEVLGDPHVTSFSEMYWFYSRTADEKIPPFETFAAQTMEATVREEVGAKSSCTKIR
jgi:hypothetical protein